MDLAQRIRLAVKRGKTEMGFRRVQVALWQGQGKYLIVAGDSSLEKLRELVRLAKRKGIGVIIFSGNSMALGSACGRPHPVSALLVYDDGGADFSSLLEEKG